MFTTMELLTVFMIGLLVGWLIEWVIDWRFWRRGHQGVEEEEFTMAQERIRQQENELAFDEDKIHQLQAYQKKERQYWHHEFRAMTQELARAKAQIDALQAARRHHRQMRDMLASAKAEITALQGRRQHDEVLQLKLASAEEQISDLQVELGTMGRKMTEILARPPEQLTDIKGIGPIFAHRLNKAGIHSFTDLAQLTPERIIEIISVGSLPNINPDNWLAQARQLAMVQPEGNQLTQINGIGSVFVHRLNKAGIRTFADLAQLTSERLMAIIAVSSLPNIKPADWIAQARQLAKNGRSEGPRT
ncbi:MAG: helix-hairpin-helix domain-containing protein [Ardenticatenaceae bacterium]